MLTLFPSELWVRSFWPQIFSFDADRAFKITANLKERRLRNRDGSTYIVGTNPEGLREEKINETAAIRILALGDSHTFGGGVNEEAGYPEQLEERLRAGTGKTEELINAGVPAYGWLEEELYLKARICCGGMIRGC